jgi:hypothetical protein
MEYDLSHIDSIKTLKKEQQLIRQRIKHRENELRLKMYEIPGELAAAGANTLIPKMFRGKITGAALNGGKKLLNKFFEPENKGPQTLLRHGVDKGGGVISLITKGLKLFKGRK